MSAKNERERDNSSPRAEEIIAEIYGSIHGLRDTGREPRAIVLPPSYYRTLQDYRATLGDVREGLSDYLGRYELFGIPIYTDGGDQIVIKTRLSDDGDTRE